MSKSITWSQLQKEKRGQKRNKIIKEVLIVIAIAIGMLIVMGVGGQTFPY